uniref:hypothetical protein n=1 Tax=Nonomuraea pusilla TaxID=46177 RepID=UPI00128EF765|nr:hypothetical protein [Nonomuraea pusilla]
MRRRPAVLFGALLAPAILAGGLLAGEMQGLEMSGALGGPVREAPVWAAFGPVPVPEPAHPDRRYGARVRVPVRVAMRRPVAARVRPEPRPRTRPVAPRKREVPEVVAVDPYAPEPVEAAGTGCPGEWDGSWLGELCGAGQQQRQEAPEGELSQDGSSGGQFEQGRLQQQLPQGEQVEGDDGSSSVVLDVTSTGYSAVLSGKGV